jgi:peroxiredoxin
MHDPTQLPNEIPQPVDDGAADGLVGLELPSLTFAATAGGQVDLREAARGTLVLYVYPRTGRPGVDPPVEWDRIPGARGCTPQACSFRDLHGELARREALVAGLSAQTPAYQREAAERLRLPFPLLADPALTLGAALGLPTFTVAGMTLYKRLTLVARDGTIAKVFYPVFPPDENAAHVLDWLERHRSAARR